MLDTIKNIVANALRIIFFIALGFGVYKCNTYFNPTFSLTITEDYAWYERIIPFKKFTVYRMENLITGEYYIGRHETRKVKDSYQGSGTKLNHNIWRFGIENFHKHIVAVYYNEQDMIDHECRLIDLQDPLSMNLKQC